MVARLQLSALIKPPQFSALITPTFLSRASRWSEGPSRRRDHDWLAFSVSALITSTLILGRRCGRKNRVADEATMLARRKRATLGP
jgi:hypothetical protein